jgi:hypothetical protein
VLYGTIGTKAKDKRLWPVTLDLVPSKIIHIRSTHMTRVPSVVAASAPAAAAAVSASASSDFGSAAASAATAQDDPTEAVTPELALILLGL